jgi:hypothetical protein
MSLWKVCITRREGLLQVCATLPEARISDKLAKRAICCVCERPLSQLAEGVYWHWYPADDTHRCEEHHLM